MSHPRFKSPGQEGLGLEDAGETPRVVELPKGKEEKSTICGIKTKLICPSGQ